MINELKLGVKLLKYTYGIKSSLLGSVLLLAGGIFYSLLPEEQSRMWLASYMILVITMFPVQLLYSLGVSNMVQASPCKRKMQTSTIVILNVSVILVLLLPILSIKGVQLAMGLRTEEYVSFELLLDAVLIFLLLLYNGFAYKFFMVATVTFCVMMVIVSGGAALSMGMGILQDVKLWLAVAILFLAILAGAALQYLVSCLLYRRPLSKQAQYAGLRKMM